MDHLFYDLVEEVVSYLPRSDVQTISRVASRRPGLLNWGAAAADQLENRFILDVRVYVQEQKNVAALFKEDAMETDEEEPKIFLSVVKHLPNGRQEQWNFLQWRLAWIQKLTIKVTLDDCPYPEVDLQKALRSVRLPVDPSIRSFLKVGHNSGSREFMMRSMDAGRRAVNLSWKILKAAKKNAFAHVSLKHYKNGDPDEFADFAVDYVERGNSLEKLRCSGSFPHKKVIKAVAPLFGRYRGRPLAVEFPENPINPDLVRSIVDKWWDSNEIFEEKQIVWGWSRRSSVWNHIENKNKSKKKFNHKFTMRDLSTGYLAHHSRCSTLSISLYGICIEKLQPWHVPVDFMWINLLIAKWKEGNGFYVYEEERDIHFTWKSDDDWDKFKRKYQVQECEPDGYIRRIKFLTLTHRSELLKLNVIKCEGSFEIGVEHKWFSDSELMSLISDWQEGNGEALLNGQKVIEVRTYWNIFSDGSVVEYAHPNKNVRCVVARQARPKRVGYPDGFDFLVRISICPSDSQRV